MAYWPTETCNETLQREFQAGPLCTALMREVLLRMYIRIRGRKLLSMYILRMLS